MAFPTFYGNCVGGYGTFAGLTSTAGLVVFGTGLFSNGVSPGANGVTAQPTLYSGTGVPVFTAAAGSLYLSYDGILYLNTSAANSFGASWTACATTGSGVASLSTSGAIFTTLTNATGAVTIAAPNAVDTINTQNIAGLKTFTTGLLSAYGITPGYNGSTGTSQIYSGTGVPAFSAPAGSLYLSYNGNGYLNTSASGTSGTSWTPLGTSTSGVSSISTSGAIFTTLTSATGAVTIAAPNAVDTTSIQTIGGTKTFSNAVTLVGGLTSDAGLTPGYSGVVGTPVIYGGSGVPSFSATEGSLFLSSNGSAYVNTSSGTGTTWTQLQSGSGAVTGVSGASPISSTGGSSPVISISSSPTFSGTVTANQFTGSGAGLTSGTVPNAALVTAPIDVSATTQSKTGSLTIGNITTTTSVTVGSSASVGTTLIVTGAATLSSSLSVGGATSLGGSMSVAGNATVSGSTTSSSGVLAPSFSSPSANGILGVYNVADFASLSAAVAAAVAAGGGVVFLPSGTYTLSSGITIGGANIHIMGAGDSSIVSLTTANMTGFSVTSFNNIKFSNFVISATASGTTGIHVTTCNYTRMDAMTFIGTAVNFAYDQGFAHELSNIICLGKTSFPLGSCKLWSSSDSAYIFQVKVFGLVMRNVGNGTAAQGLYIRRGVGVHVFGFDCNDFNTGNGSPATGITIENDCQGCKIVAPIMSAAGYGILVQQGSGVAVAPSFCEFLSADLDQSYTAAIQVTAGSRLSFIGGKITASGIATNINAAVVGSAASLVEFLGMAFDGYNGGGVGIILSGCAHVAVRNCMFSNVSNGIATNSAPSNCSIMGNHFYGTANDYNLTGTPTVFVFSDNAFDTSAGVATAPSVPASGTNATNPNFRDCTVYINANGATITGVAVNNQQTGVAGSLTNYTVRVPANGVIQIGYGGGPPTWKWFTETA